MQLGTASALNDRQRVTGGEGVSEGFVELVVRKLPFRPWRFQFRGTGVSMTFGPTALGWLAVSHTHGLFLKWPSLARRVSLLLRLPAALEQEPDALLGFVNPVLQQACGGHIARLVAQRVRLTHALRQGRIVTPKFRYHV